jgi:hypothetical protein
LKDITSEFNRTPVKVSRRTLHSLGYTRRSVRKSIGIPEIEVANLYVAFDFYASNPQIHGTYDKKHCHLGSIMYCYQNV